MSPMLVVGVLTLIAVLVVGVLVLVVGSNDAGDIDGGAAEASPTVATEPPVVTEAPEVTAPTTAPPSEPVAEGPTVDELASAVVQIQLLRNGTAVCTGSGTIVEPDGTILTNSHVISPAPPCEYDRIGVATIDIPELPPQLLFEADVLVDDPVLDLAVVRIVRRLNGGDVVSNFPTVEIGDSDDLGLGDNLRVIGFPGVGGETVTFTQGTISGFVAQPGIGERSWLKTDTVISGGNSGGLAADDTGRLVGIPTIVGTGEGRFADCRFVEDTNGDGRLDSDDGCVPVGGFINGIRPVNVALALIDDARGATPITPGTPSVPTTTPNDTPTTPATGVIAANPRFSLQTADGFPDPEVFAVPDGSAQVCLTWDYRGFAPGGAFEIQWKIDGVVDVSSITSGTNQGAVDGAFFGCIANPDGLAAGLYEATWLVDGELVFAHGIFVGGSRSVHAIGLQNNTAADICAVQWSPLGASTGGLPRNVTPVRPGESFSIQLAGGVYATRVIDCDGNVIFDERSGTEFSGDLTLTLPV